MNNSTRKARIYLEDTVAIPADNKIGVVIRTWHDLEQPRNTLPLQDGEFEVNWLDELGTYATRKLPGDSITIGHEDDLDHYRVIDRSFGLGDAVKLDSSAAMSGIVTNGRSELTLRNFITREIRSAPGDSVTVPSEVYQIGDHVICNSWVGQIKQIVRKTLVLFRGNELAFCDEYETNPFEYEEDSIFYPDLLPCTTLVEVSKKGARQAKYLCGKYSKGMRRVGVVCTSFTSRIVVDWLFQNMMASPFVVKERPPEELLVEVGGAHTSDVLTCKLFDGMFSHQIGDVVHTDELPDSWPTHSEHRIESLGGLEKRCFDWEVISTKQEISVKWQDGSSSSHAAVDLVPYLNVDDLDLWPADHVVSKVTGDSGIVQTCSAADRVATVLWSQEREPREESLYELMNDGAYDIDLGDLVLIVPKDGHKKFSPGTDGRTWGPSTIVTAISGFLAKFPVPVNGTSSESDPHVQQVTVEKNESAGDISWFGQVIAIDNNGICDVCLGYSRPTRVVKVELQRLIHIASSGGDDEDDETDESYVGSDLDIDSTDSGSDNYSGDDDLTMAEHVPWTDESGHTVSLEEEIDWEDDSAMDDESTSDSDNELLMDVVAEQLTKIDTSNEVVLDVKAAPRKVSGPLNQQACEDRLAAQAISGRPERSPHISQAGTDTQQDVPYGMHTDRKSEVTEAAQAIPIHQHMFPVSDDKFSPFLVLDVEPADHTFVTTAHNRQASSMRRIAQEFKTLRSSLPPGILIRAYESRMDLLRAVIIGPLGTPYEYAPMLFDLCLPPEFPEVPPLVHFHSWTNGIGRVNPNLYEEGKVCLSLLGTWHGNSESETWTSKSSLLQIFVSLQALVLVKEPYYNEAGYEILSAKDTAVAAANYSERAFVLTRGFCAYALQNPIQGLVEELRWLYHGEPGFLALLMARAETVVSNSDHRTQTAAKTEDGSVISVSKGALLLLKRTLRALHQELCRV